MVLAGNDDLVGIFSLCIQPTAANLFSLSPENTPTVLPRFGKIPGARSEWLLCTMLTLRRSPTGPT